MKCTLVTFTFSYIVAVGRTLGIYFVIVDKSIKIEIWTCENNFLVNCINVFTFFGIDLIPIGTIFYLHWKNFRTED